MRSSFITLPYWLAYCKIIFGNNTAPPAIDYIMSYTGGLEITGENIYFANAIEDPWQWAGMRSINNSTT